MRWWRCLPHPASARAEWKAGARGRSVKITIATPAVRRSRRRGMQSVVNTTIEGPAGTWPPSPAPRLTTTAGADVLVVKDLQLRAWLHQRICAHLVVIVMQLEFIRRRDGPGRTGETQCAHRSLVSLAQQSLASFLMQSVTLILIRAS